MKRVWSNTKAPILGESAKEPRPVWRLRCRWGPLALALGVAASCLAAAGGAPPRAAAEHRPAAPRLVCGKLSADGSYAAELRMLGASHACQHLRVRRSTGSTPPRGHDSAVRSHAAGRAVDPAISGRWSRPFRPDTTAIGITSVLLHTGKVLLFGGSAASGGRGTAAYLLDPVHRTGTDVPAPARVFCSGVTQLSDGRVLSVGGTSTTPRGIVDVYLFDPATNRWVRQPDTNRGRYYPTTTRLPHGRVLIAAGTEPDGRTSNPKIEIYTPPAAGTERGSLKVVGPDHATAYYPQQWVMPDGNLLQLAAANTFSFDPDTRSWTRLRGKPIGVKGAGGLMLAGTPGGSSRLDVVGGIRRHGTVIAAVQRYDYLKDRWTRGADMPMPRAHMNVVQLPDGRAIGLGGNSRGLSELGQHSAMLYRPGLGRWTTLASQLPRRAYHSTALLLPDGRIMSAGDDKAGGGGQQIDFFYPPYLFAGPRPTITSAPKRVRHRTTFAIRTARATVRRVVLMAPAATTHAVDMNARHIELRIRHVGKGHFRVRSPVARLAPSGYYMMFALTPAGVPSMARWVHVS